MWNLSLFHQEPQPFISHFPSGLQTHHLPLLVSDLWNPAF